mmetsp:Transcript_17957/g.51758  ORF Transcript_17957/g.51758 Transcript_17957/m.51758 type:complete len:205 (-) Transcript_17957:653-1267(-)
MFSPSNVSLSLDSRSLIFLIWDGFISSFLYSSNAFMKPTSESIAFAPGHPAFSSSFPSGLRMQMHKQTFATLGGGTGKDLTSVIDALSKSSSALAAASKAGNASASAASASAFSRSISMLSSAIFDAAALASSLRCVATTVFSLIVMMSCSTFFAFSSTMIFFSASSADISLTCWAACTNLSKPPPKRACIISKFFRFKSKNFM